MGYTISNLNLGYKMKKTKTVVTKDKVIKGTTKEVTKTYCDFCDKLSADHYGNERRCMCCGRDICRTHQTYDPNETGDYGGQYCPICIKLYYNKYQDLYWKLQEKHDKEEEQMWAEMKKESYEGTIS